MNRAYKKKLENTLENLKVIKIKSRNKNINKIKGNKPKIDIPVEVRIYPLIWKG